MCGLGVQCRFSVYLHYENANYNVSDCLSLLSILLFHLECPLAKLIMSQVLITLITDHLLLQG